MKIGLMQRLRVGQVDLLHNSETRSVTASHVQGSVQMSVLNARAAPNVFEHAADNTSDSIVLLSETRRAAGVTLEQN